MIRSGREIVEMEKIYGEIESNVERYITELFTLLKQPSISSQGVGVEDCARLLADMMADAGIDTEILPMEDRGNHPVVYGEISSPDAEKTVLIYGHFDVQPPDPLEQWDSPPFEPTIRNGRIYARGVADNKGQLFAHIKAVEAIMNTQKTLPVNLKFLMDPEEEIGSPGLENFVKSNRERFAADVAYNADGSMDSSGRPILSFGNRGDCFVEIKHREANRDLHSGQFGGPAPNPNRRIIDFLSTLWNADGRVAIDGFYDSIEPPTAAEKDAIAKIPFDQQAMLDHLGLKKFSGPEDMGFWEQIMFQPTLNICGYASGYGGEGTKTVIPCETRVKIDMRLVKNQLPQEIFDKFKRHMVKFGFEDLELKLLVAYKPCKTPIDHPAGKAIVAAAHAAFEREPILFPLTGGSNPSSVISEVLEIPIFKIPYGNYDATNHAPNENLIIGHFVNGIKCSAKVFYEIGGV